MKKALLSMFVVGIAVSMSSAAAAPFNTDVMGQGTLAPGVAFPFGTDWTSNWGDTTTLGVDDNANAWLGSNGAKNYGHGADRRIGVYSGSSGDVRWLKVAVTTDANGEFQVPDFLLVCEGFRTSGSNWGGVRVTMPGAAEQYKASIGQIASDPVGYLGSHIGGSIGGLQTVPFTNVTFTGMTPNTATEVTFNFRDGLSTPSGYSGGNKKRAFMSLDFDPIPEPATMSLLGVGALALLRRKK